jgi:hypothetical protein
MSFGNPQGLWLLALGVPILAFHFYRGRIRRLPVPTLLFWERVLVEEERRTALRRLRHYASLLLNLAALVLLTSAVSDPEVKALSRPRSRVALVLDGTASMGAVEPDGRTRLDHAVDRARGFLRTLGPGDRASLHDLSGPRLPMSDDPGKLAESLAPPPPGRAPADLRARLAEALAGGEDTTAVLFTDRPPAGAEDLLESGRLRWIRVGTPRDNSGWISGLAIRRAGEKRTTLSLTRADFSAAGTAREEILLWNGREISRRPAKTAPGAPSRVEWVLDPERHPEARIEEGGLAEVALEPRDALPLDDVASFVVPPLAPATVVVFHPGKPDDFLMNALLALQARGLCGPPSVAAADRYPALRNRLGEGSLVVFDRVAPPPLTGRGTFLVIGARRGTPVDRPAIVDWDREAPPNFRVDYSGVALRRSCLLEGRPLLRSLDGPVASWSAQGGRAAVELGFSLEDTDLKLLPPFLMMLQNLAEWAAFGATRSFRTEYAAGEPLIPERPLWVEEGDLVLSRDGREEPLAVRQGRLAAPPRTGPGLVRISGTGRSEWTAVNLFDAAESDLRDPGAGTPGRPLPPPVPWTARIPWGFAAAAAVLAILLVEWGLFHRGLI